MFLYSRHKAIGEAIALVKELVAFSAKVYLYVAPRATLLVEHMFASAYCRDNVRLMKDLELDIAVFDSNILSMEQHVSTRELLIENSPSVLHSVARSLMKMQVFYGPFVKTRRMGAHAESVSRIMEQMMAETADIYKGQSSSIHTLFLFDRAVDLLAPLTTQGTYAGHLAELWGESLGSNFVLTLPFEQFVDEEEKELLEELVLTDADPIFADVRGMAMTAAGGALQRKAQNMRQVLAEGHNLKKIKRSKDFTRAATQYAKQVKNVMSEQNLLSAHIDVFKRLKKDLQSNDLLKNKKEMEMYLLDENDKDISCKILEDLIFQGEDFGTVLRCLCTFCIGCGGLKDKIYDRYRILFVQQYGAQAMTAWNTMEQAGLIFTTKGKTSQQYTNLRSALSLFKKDYATNPVHCVSYGSAPIIAKVLEKTISSRDWGTGWRAVAESCTQAGVNPVYPTAEDTEVDVRETGKTRVAVVYFLGGLTFAEWGALRNLQEHLANESENEQPVQLIIATTSIIRDVSEAFK